MQTPQSAVLLGPIGVLNPANTPSVLRDVRVSLLWTGTLGFLQGSADQ